MADTASIIISAFLSTIIFIAGLLIGSWQNKSILHAGAKRMLQVLKLQNQPDFEYLDYDIKKGDFVYKKIPERTTGEQD